MPTGAPEISLGQKYLTTTTSFDPIYMTLDQHRDIKKLTGAIDHTDCSTCLSTILKYLTSLVSATTVQPFG